MSVCGSIICSKPSELTEKKQATFHSSTVNSHTEIYVVLLLLCHKVAGALFAANFVKHESNMADTEDY